MGPGMGIVWAFTAISVPFLWAAGLTVLGYPNPSFMLASACFILGGVVLAGATVMWAVKSWPLSGWKFAAMVGLALLSVGAPVAGVIWASHQAAAQTTASRQRKLQQLRQQQHQL